MQPLRFGFSPCPNDTFAFGAAVQGRIAGGVPLLPVMADIEALNQRALRGVDPLPVSKLSLPALSAVADRYTVLPAGAALGFHCGPLVVRRAADVHLDGMPALAGRRVAIPGRATTAFALFGMFGPLACDFVELRFDTILGAVAAGTCDAGLIIHESRFTYRDHGLHAVADLGELWHAACGLPLPLGVIAAQRDLPAATIAALADTLRRSVADARTAPDCVTPFVRDHARELSPQVQQAHIDLYVNEFTVDLGPRGVAAIDEFLARGRARGLLSGAASPWGRA